MKRVFKKNQIIIAALAVMIAVAGYLNYSGKIFHEKDGGAEEANADLANQELLDISEEDIETVGDEIASNDSDVEGTPGEAVLTNGSAETTVAQAKVTREQVRAQNKETLQAIIDNTNLSESEKQEAVSQLVQMTQIAEQEAAVETMMASKGFSEAVVSIDADGRVDGEVSHTIPVGNDRTEITETNAINVSTGMQDAYAVDLTVIDTVSMVNLMPNREYKLQLILADAKTGEPLKVKDQPSGDLLTTEKTFTADSSKMDVDIQIEFEASPFAGRTIVAYEYLYQDGVEISRHEDPNDKKQQIYVKDKLKLNTTAIDLISGTHEAIAKKDVTIRDNVDHFGLIKGQEYVLKGILMDQTTGKPLVINGKQITAEKSVQIETADGTVPIDFTLDASELNNRSIVVYEYLYHNGQLIASHEDITDEDQTITFKVGSLKPILPPNKGGGLLSALKTGDFSDIMPFAIALIGTGTIILSIVIYNHRKKKKREE